VTLLFAQSAYEPSPSFHLLPGSARSQGFARQHIASVASFFVSRIYTLIDGKELMKC